MGFFYEGHDVCPMQHQKESAFVPKPDDSSAQSTGEFAYCWLCVRRAEWSGLFFCWRTKKGKGLYVCMDELIQSVS